MLDSFFQQDAFSLVSFLIGAIGTALTACFGFVPLYIRWRNEALDQDEELFAVTMRYKAYKKAREKEINQLNARLDNCHHRLDKVDPERFIEKAMDFYESGQFDKAEEAAENFSNLQTEAVGLAAQYLAEQRIIDSETDGSLAARDAVRFATIGLAAYPESKRLAKLLELAETRLAGANRGEPIETLHWDGLTDVELNHASMALVEAGNYQLAEVAARRSVPLARIRTGEESENFASALSQHSETLRLLGDFEEAKKVASFASKISESLSGQSRSVEYNNLALIAQSQGDLEEADRLFEISGSIVSQAEGEDSEAYLIHLNNVSMLRKEQGRTADAEDLLRAVLSKVRKIGGLDRATAYSNLGIVVAAQGRRLEAEFILRRAGALFQEDDRSRHPLYAMSLNSLASVVFELGRKSEALEIQREAVSVAVDALGTEHRETALYQSRLAELIQILNFPNGHLLTN